MPYYDPLYGEWNPPPIVEALIHTPLMARLRRITQSVLPNELIPDGPIPSRFQHCMGAAYLATRVVEENPHLPEDIKTLLPVAAVLHDAGNPPFSHLSEPFLQEVWNRNGETFLASVLHDRVGREAKRILEGAGISLSRRCRAIAGM